MNLIIDLGNTNSKLGVFQKGTIIELFRFNNLEKRHIVDILFKYPKINKSIISSVVDINAEITNYLYQNLKYSIELNYKTRSPIKIKYNSKSTLGNDRIAGVVGANNIFPNSNVMVIDIGTAITYDFISDKNIFIGGNISPGLNLRYKALNKFTSRLPLLEKKEIFDFIGTDTNSAIISGVQNGIIYEIDAYIDEFNSQHEDCKIILTGGDSFFFETKLKNAIFAEPNLVLIGLNKILEYNAQ